jgi:hypothetical protein
MKYNLEQHIAQFFNHFLVILAFDGIQQLVNFLDGIANVASCDPVSRSKASVR